MRRTDTIDGLCRRMNSLLRNGKAADAAQEFADPGCEVFVNGHPNGSGKSAIKKLGEMLAQKIPDGKFELLNHTVSDDDHSYGEWRVSNANAGMHGILLCQWENNHVVVAKIFGQ